MWLVCWGWPWSKYQGGVLVQLRQLPMLQRLLLLWQLRVLRQRLSRLQFGVVRQRVPLLEGLVMRWQLLHLKGPLRAVPVQLLQHLPLLGRLAWVGLRWQASLWVARHLVAWLPLGCLVGKQQGTFSLLEQCGSRIRSRKVAMGGRRQLHRLWRLLCLQLWVWPQLSSWLVACSMQSPVRGRRGALAMPQ